MDISTAQWDCTRTPLPPKLAIGGGGEQQTFPNDSNAHFIFVSVCVAQSE